MLTDMLRILVVLCSGTVAGVFIAVTVSIMPALAVLPVSSYVQVHRLMGNGYHPMMPLVVLIVLVGDIALALITGRATQTALLSAAIVLQFGVQAVSHLGNEPLNKRVRAADGDAVGPDWDDPRAAWRRWHLLRTVLAMAVFAINATVAAIPS
jgi:uncharacterized membrane protein